MKLMTWKRRNFPMASCEMISRWWYIDIYIYVEDIEVLDSSMDIGNAYVLTTWLEQGKTPEILVHWGDPTHSRSRYGMMEVRFVKTKGNPTSYLGFCLENCHEKIQLWVTHGHFRWVMYGHVFFFALSSDWIYMRLLQCATKFLKTVGPYKMTIPWQQTWS